MEYLFDNEDLPETMKDGEKHFMAGFDYAFTGVIMNFFANLDIYYDDEAFIIHMLEKPIHKRHGDDGPYNMRKPDSNKFETEHVKDYLDQFKKNLLCFANNERWGLIEEIESQHMEEDINEALNEADPNFDIPDEV